MCKAVSAARRLVPRATARRLPATMAIGVALAGALFPPSAVAAVPPPAGSALLSLKVSELYQVALPPGSWLPVVISATDRGSTPIAGEVEVRPDGGGVVEGGCYADGPSTFTCPDQGQLGYGAAPFGAGAGAAPPVSYRYPVTLLPGVQKTFTAFVLDPGPGGNVGASFVGPGGTVLTRAVTALGSTPALPAPTVLIITDDPGTLGELAAAGDLAAPTGSVLQAQLLSPAQVPASPSALGVFRAVLVDQAGTGAFSPEQSAALAGYVDAGGALVVAGGLAAPGDAAGLPAGLLPGRFTARLTPSALATLPTALGAPPLSASGLVAGIQPAAGSHTTVSDGRQPLVVEAAKGLGAAVVCALDPAAPPFVHWPGARALMERLLAPAFVAGYDGAPLPYGEPGGAFPVSAVSLPGAMVAQLGAEFSAPTPLLGALMPASLLSTYLAQAPNPAMPPSAVLLGLLLLVYVVLIGVTWWLAARQGRRRPRSWLAFPALVALAVGVVAVALSPHPAPLVYTADAVVLPPGGTGAEVVTAGVVDLPPGGGARLTVSPASPGPAGAAPPGPVLVAGVPFSGQARLTLTPGFGAAGAVFQASGPGPPSGAWASSRYEAVKGMVQVQTVRSGGGVAGVVSNHLGTVLEDGQVVIASGAATAMLGELRSGAVKRFEVSVEPYEQPSQIAFTAPPGVLGIDGPHGHPGTEELLNDLGAAFSAQLGGAPVLVALARGSLVDRGWEGRLRAGAATEVVVVPFAAPEAPPGAGAAVQAQMVGSSGVGGASSTALTTTSLALARGGSFYYQFLLSRPAPSRHLAVDLGSPIGWQGAPVLRLSVFEGTRGWVPLRALRRGGSELAPLAPAGPVVGRTVELRATAAVPGVELLGAEPQLIGLGGGVTRGH